MEVVLINLIVSCMVAQPNGKGVYPTYMKALGHNEKYFVVESGKDVLREGARYAQVTAIEKKFCKIAFKPKEI